MIAVLVLAGGFLAELPSSASGAHGVVVAGLPGSAEAGLEILQQGGKAADAAAATILALTVTDHGAFCFGAEVPILVYDAERGVVEALAGMGAAPSLAAREYFESHGGIAGGTPRSAAVPAVLDACITLLDRYGTMTFAQVAAPGLRLLDAGKEEWHPNLARTWRRLIEAEASAGERRQGLRRAADCFYRGPVAREIDAWSRVKGGLLRYSDLARHVTRVEEPISVDYHGYGVYKCGPWTQGPCLLQALRLLEGFPLEEKGLHTPDTVHLVVEALKLDMADRDEHYGDPLFVDVPLQALLSDEYARLRRSLLDVAAASTERRPGDPVTLQPLLAQSKVQTGAATRSHDTTNCLVADRWGNVVAATPSGWGGVLAGDTGVWLGSRLISFNTWEGHPNCVEPGKRPRITLTPSLVLKDGKPVLAVSVLGGDSQDQASLQIITNYVHFTRDAERLVTTPGYDTLHYVGSFGATPPKLGMLKMTEKNPPELREELARRGHVVEVGPIGQGRTVIVIDREKDVLYGAGDPEAMIERHVAAY